MKKQIQLRLAYMMRYNPPYSACQTYSHIWHFGMAHSSNVVSWQSYEDSEILHYDSKTSYGSGLFLSETYDTLDPKASYASSSFPFSWFSICMTSTNIQQSELNYGGCLLWNRLGMWPSAVQKFCWRWRIELFWSCN